MSDGSIKSAEAQVQVFENAREQYLEWQEEIQKDPKLAQVLDDDHRLRSTMNSAFEEAKAAVKDCETTVGEFLYSTQRRKNFLGPQFVRYINTKPAELKKLGIKGLRTLFSLGGAAVTIKVDLDKLKARLINYTEDHKGVPWTHEDDAAFDGLKEKFIEYRISKVVHGPS
jgi:hypothetical protein